MAPSLGPHTLCECCGSILLICQNQECGKPFPRPYEAGQISKWGKRSYCSPACAQKNRQVVRFADRVLEVKPCAYAGCTSQCVQKPGEGARWEVRKYCSPRCHQLDRRKGAESTREKKARRKAERAAAGIPPKRVAQPKPKPQPAPAPVQPPVQLPPTPPQELWRPAAWRK